ncbi:hypothetical protein BH24ACT1_BH24ACT1_07090 [soil metagenome]
MIEPAVVDDLARVAAILARTDEVALACHVHPDGDALGSLLAFHLLCRSHGISSVASWGEPFAVAPHYQFLPGLDLASPPAAFPPRPEVIVTFDCGSLRRLGELERPAQAAGELVVLDHHADSARFGSVTGIDVGTVASELGGGGHHFMAGFTSDRSIPATIERITDRLGCLAPARV